MKKIRCVLTDFEAQAIKIMSMMMYKKLLANKTENDDNRDLRYGLLDLHGKMADAEDFMAKYGDDDAQS